MFLLPVSKLRNSVTLHGDKMSNRAQSAMDQLVPLGAHNNDKLLGVIAEDKTSQGNFCSLCLATSGSAIYDLCDLGHCLSFFCVGMVKYSQP